jgi:hypothetical protein
MSYSKYYSGGWQDGSSGGTPITAEALNHMEQGIIDSESISLTKITDCNNATDPRKYITQTEARPISTAPKQDGV